MPTVGQYQKEQIWYKCGKAGQHLILPQNLHLVEWEQGYCLLMNVTSLGHSLLIRSNSRLIISNTDTNPILVLTPKGADNYGDKATSMH